MRRTEFVALITRLSPSDGTHVERRACTLDGDPIHFAEALAAELPAGHHLIDIHDTYDRWAFETKMQVTWRKGVPVRRMRRRPA